MPAVTLESALQDNRHVAMARSFHSPLAVRGSRGEDLRLRFHPQAGDEPIFFLAADVLFEMLLISTRFSNLYVRK